MLPTTENGASVQLNHLSYSYPSRPSLLRDVDLRIEPGERVGLVADRGRGKSSLLKLLCALRTPQSGTIRIDGLDIREIEKTSLRSTVTLLSEVEVFDGRLIDNVRFNGDVHLAEARQALEAAGLLDEVLSLPDGLDTHLATGGKPLSPRQTKQLMFARAFVAEPRLLLVDDILDGIRDLANEGQLLDSLFSKDAPWTLVVTSSEPAVLSRCDRVFELTDGKLRLVDRNSFSDR